MQLSPTIERVQKAIGGLDLSRTQIAISEEGNILVWLSKPNFIRVLDGQVPNLITPNVEGLLYYDAHIVRDGIDIRCQFWQRIQEPKT